MSHSKIFFRGPGLISYRKQATRNPTQTNSPQTPYYSYYKYSVWKCKVRLDIHTRTQTIIIFTDIVVTPNSHIPPSLPRNRTILRRRSFLLASSPGSVLPPKPPEPGDESAFPPLERLVFPEDTPSPPADASAERCRSSSGKIWEKGIGVRTKSV